MWESEWWWECGSTARLWTPTATTGPARRAKTENPAQNQVLRAEKVGRTCLTLSICWETPGWESVCIAGVVRTLLQPQHQTWQLVWCAKNQIQTPPFFTKNAISAVSNRRSLAQMGVPQPGDDSLLLEVSEQSRHKQGQIQPQSAGGCRNAHFTISPWFSDHLRKWFSGTVPTGAVGTPGKDRNNLMARVASEVQDLDCSLICFQKRTAELELHAASQHLCYPEFWSRQEHWHLQLQVSDSWCWAYILAISFLTEDSAQNFLSQLTNFSKNRNTKFLLPVRK